MRLSKGLLVIKAGGGERPGEEEDGVRNRGGTIKNRRRDAPKHGDINQFKAGQPDGKARGNVGVTFAGYLYCTLCRKEGGKAQREAAKPIIKRRKTSPIHGVYHAARRGGELFKST